jgi:hypothetical protein
MAPAGAAPPATVIICGAKIVVNDASMMRCILPELRQACHFFGDEVVSGIAKGRSSLLAQLAEITGKHYRGFQQVARVNKAWLPGSVVKHLVRLDVAFSELWHFAEVGWLGDLAEGSHPDVAFRGGSSNMVFSKDMDFDVD